MSQIKITSEDIRLELWRRKYNKIDSYFPEEGPLRRELYTKNMEFFDLGRENQERTVMAANRVGKCITANTLVETPNGSRSVRDLYEDKKPFDVMAWNGEKVVTAKAHSPFLKKGWHDCYRVTLSDGKYFECADDHRILTHSGWKLFSQLLPQYGIYHRPSILERARSTHALNDLHWIEKLASFLDGCFENFRQCGEQLRVAINTSLVFVQQQGGAQKHIAPLFCKDDPANKYTNNPLQACVHLSSQCVFRLGEARFSDLSNQISLTNVEQLSCLFLKPWKFVLGLKDLFRSSFSKYHGILHNEPLAFYSPISVDSNKIVSVNFIGRNRVYDFTVDQYHNYICAGLVHHNTESMGGYEIVCHASGRYPLWWTGRRFSKPVNFLIAGETGKLVRDSIQLKLLGPMHDKGTGLIRLDDIASTTPKQGIPNAVDIIYVNHPKGQSVLQLQSYDQGREAFQATERDGIWYDEEPPLDIYAEGLIRTTTTNGMIISTFTPLKGMSETVLSLMEKQSHGIGKIIVATWDDAPHLSKETKDKLWNALPPHQRDARTKGIPALGSGAIYPVEEDLITIQDFQIPPHWKISYGMDVGWNNTAALWTAWDQETDTVYVMNEYKRGQAEPSSHAAAIKAPGEWIKGVIDPASAGSNQKDGTKLMEEYIALGLHISPADNSVEAGLFEVYQRMTTGRLKIFKSCVKTIQELRLYRRDEKGKIVKENDHLMDCMRYDIVSGLEVACVKTDSVKHNIPGYSMRNAGNFR